MLKQIDSGIIVVGRWNYSSRGIVMSNGEKDISFKKNDRMKVLSLCPNDWLLVQLECDGSTGVVPKSYMMIEEIPSNASSMAITPPFVEQKFSPVTVSPSSSNVVQEGADNAPEYVEALWDYNAVGLSMSNGDTDISFRKMDRMILLETCPNSWIRVDHNGIRGVIPSNYVKNIGRRPPPQRLVRAPALQSSLVASSSSLPKANDDQESPKNEASSLRRTQTAETPNAKGSSSPVSSKLKMMKVLGVPESVVDELVTRRSASLNNNISQTILNTNENSVSEEKLSQKLVFPSDYLFSEEDSLANILFTKAPEIARESNNSLIDSDTVTLQIRGATVIKLVERLTYPNFVDPDFLFEFLLTFRSFTNPKELLDLLIKRFQVPIPDYMRENEKEQEIFQRIFVKPVRLRVFNVIKKWIEDHWYDFESNWSLLEDLRNFIEQIMRTCGMETHANHLTKTINRMCEGVTRETIYVPGQKPPEPHHPDVKQLVGLGSHMMVIAFHPEEVARQLTLIEYELFRNVKPWELIGQCWTKSDKNDRAKKHIGND